MRCHRYNLRSSAKDPVQSRLDACVAAYGEQNRDKILAVPSNTGQGVHLYFDPERSLSPAPLREIEGQRRNPTEAILTEDPAGRDSPMGPDTPDRTGQFGPISPLRTPRALRHRNQGNWRDDTTPSTLDVHDTMASIMRHRIARHSHPVNTQARRRLAGERQRGEEHDICLQQIHHLDEQEPRDTSEQIAGLRYDYEKRIEEFRCQNAEIFARRSANEYGPTEGPNPEGETAPPPCSQPSSPQYPRPSRLGPQMLEDYRGNQPHRQSGKKPIIPSADRSYVVVSKRAGKLGPCNTWVIDHQTGEQIMETVRYRVRADKLQRIDEDGDIAIE